jgi:hypothetical protein
LLSDLAVAWAIALNNSDQVRSLETKTFAEPCWVSCWPMLAACGMLYSMLYSIHVLRLRRGRMDARRLARLHGGFFFVHHHHLHTSSSGRPVGCKSPLLKQHLNTHKQQLRTLGLQIIIHHTHAPVHKQIWSGGSRVVANVYKKVSYMRGG